MKIWIMAAACAAASTLALAQELPTKKKEPAKPAATKPAAAGSVATVNGVAVPQSRMDLMMQRQGQRGMPDNEQTRTMVREELINREVIAQEAQRAGLAKRQEVQTQVEFARQEILVNAFISDWLRKNPISDADVQKEYERVKAQAGELERLRDRAHWTDAHFLRVAPGIGEGDEAGERREAERARALARHHDRGRGAVGGLR